MLQKVLSVVLLGFAMSSVTHATDMAQLATPCATCHGSQGEGNPSIGAPRLAGQNAAYLARQLENFSSGKRAYNPQDLRGVAMRSASKGLTEADIQQLAIFYSQLNETRYMRSTAHQVGAKAGGELYVSTCAACHGLHAQGYAQLQAPNLNILDSEYISRQMESFDKGWRGDPEQSDQPAVWMRSIATHISSPKELTAVIEYIGTQSTAGQ